MRADTVPLLLRLNKKTHRRIVKSAKRNSRSLNAEIGNRLEQTFVRYDQELAILQAIDRTAKRVVAMFIRRTK
jgi:hypothetical protein